MKAKPLFYFVWLVFFLISQAAFSVHKLTHFEETPHQEDCFVCDLASSVCFDSSEKPTPFIAFEKNTYEQEKLIFIKKSLYFQLFPRPPPLRNI